MDRDPATPIRNDRPLENEMDVNADHGSDSPFSARLASALSAILGAGFGIGATWTVTHLLQHDELPMTPWGFRSMAGPFEDLGPGPLVVLGVGLVALCAVDVIAAVWLWQGRRRGGILSLITAVPCLALAIGFALPFLLLGIPVRTALVLNAWSRLR